MKMPSALVAALLVSATAVAQSPDPTPRDIVVGLRTYKAAVVTGVADDGLDIRFAGGMAHLLFRELPKDLQEQYGYNPAKAAQAEAVDAQEQQRNYAAGQVAQQQAKQQSQLEKQQVAQRDADENKRVKRDAMKPKVKQWRTGLAVVSSFDGGIIAHQWADGLGIISGEVVYAVYGLDGTDGERIKEQPLYEAGTFTYTSVTGARKKIKAYALTAEDALAKQGY